MPDILILGYSAPASCATCHFNSNAFCDVLGRKVKIPVDYVERPNTCPLVELPPHGDLIDRDEYVKSECNNCDGSCECVECDCLNCEQSCRCDVIVDVMNAPVVVPAERSDTDA